MDNLVNLGSVKQLGNKLASFNPFGKADETPASAESASSGAAPPPPSSDSASAETVATATTTESSDTSQQPQQGDAKTSEAGNSSTLAGASAMFTQAFNPVRNLGSKLGGFISQSVSPGAEGEKEASAQPAEATAESNTTRSEESATEKFKTFGTSLFSYGKQASASMLKTTTGALEQIKKTVEESTPIIADFSKEQDKFLEEKRQNQAGPAVPPWCGAAGGAEAEEQLRVRILELSADERNVLRPVPAGQTFEFDMRAHSSIAKLMLSLDPRLDSLRFKFVPKRITEENFWRNYFYRVSLLKQTTDLMSSANSAVAAQSANTANPTNVTSNSQSTESPEEQNPDFQEELERAVQQELNEYELVDGAGDLAADESERNLEAEILAEIGSK